MNKTLNYKLILLFIALFYSAIIHLSPIGGVGGGYWGGAFAQEICDNGKDDDADGRIDLNDTISCKCNDGSDTLIITSLINNPSFEIKSGCPYEFSQPGNPSLDLATGWKQVTEPTSDYLNSACSWLPPNLASSGLIPFPDGDGIAGTLFVNGWKEYLGNCLSSPLIAGVTYTLKFFLGYENTTDKGESCSFYNYGDAKVTLFGATSCNDLNYVNTRDCPSSASSAWNVLGNVNYQFENPTTFNGNKWRKFSITFTTCNNINAIMLGPPCDLPNTYPSEDSSSACYPYFYYDNLILNKTELFSLVSIGSTCHNCSDSILLKAMVSATVTSNAKFQWFKNGIAVVGATDSVFKDEVNQFTLGDYQVKLTDGLICSISSKYNINNMSPATMFVNNGNICIGDTVNLIANNSFETIHWSSNETTYSISVSPLLKTSYTVVGTYGNCTSTAVATVAIFSHTLAISSSVTICSGASSILSVSGIQNSLLWQETNLNTLSSYTLAFVIASPTATTSYTVNSSYQDYYHISSDYIAFITCPSNAQTTVFVYPPTNVDAGSEKVIYLGNDVQLNATGGNTYQWQPTTGLSSYSIFNPIANPTTTTIYTLTAIDLNGCIANDTITVVVKTDCGNISVANAFSPNGDKINDDFTLNGECIKELEVIIFNRWGEEIINNKIKNENGNNVIPLWDGSFKGVLLNKEVFFYQIKAILSTKKTVSKHGNVSLIK